MDEHFTRRTSSPQGLSTEQLIGLWLLPLHVWSSWWSTCLSFPPSQRLNRKDLEDKEHAQLVVPPPLKSSDDRELFA